jgi:hypothetical protein
MESSVLAFSQKWGKLCCASMSHKPDYKKIFPPTMGCISYPFARQSVRYPCLPCNGGFGNLFVNLFERTAGRRAKALGSAI